VAARSRRQFNIHSYRASTAHYSQLSRRFLSSPGIADSAAEDHVLAASSSPFARFSGIIQLKLHRAANTDRNSRHAEIIQATPQNSHIIIATISPRFSLAGHNYEIFLSLFFLVVARNHGIIEIQSFAASINRVPRTSSLICRAEALVRSKISTVFGGTRAECQCCWPSHARRDHTADVVLCLNTCYSLTCINKIGN
jgi:hypothetical protein